jgi:pseudaminic acid synthase
MDILINDRCIGPHCPPYIIAELSANHNGSLDRALETIQEAKRRGADAIKIQTYTADTMTIDSNLPDFMIRGGLWDGYKLYDLYKWAETRFEWHEEIFRYARNLGITLFSTPFDETAVDLLEDLNAPAYKIASFELLDLPLIRYCAGTRKPIIMSTGMANNAEIEEAVTAAREAGCRDLILLHCVSSYPTATEQSNLRRIPAIQHRFGTMVGLSDHTMGSTVSVAAVALGACVIEKHFTLSRNDKGPDSEFSLEPNDLEKLCIDAKEAWKSLGSDHESRSTAEEANKIFRRSLYFVKDLPAGHTIEEGDIRRIRPGLGLPPKHLPELLGRRLRVAVTRGTATSPDIFET